jgi:hypothetical protein
MRKRELRCRDGHRARIAQERRAEPRLLCSDLLQVRWTTASGALKKEFAVVQDFSEGGASIVVGVPLAPATQVTLQAGDRVFHGTARHCRREPNGYVVGVKFDGGCEGYVPEHLLEAGYRHPEIDR